MPAAARYLNARSNRDTDTFYGRGEVVDGKYFENEHSRARFFIFGNAIPREISFYKNEIARGIPFSKMKSRAGVFIFRNIFPSTTSPLP